MKFERHPLEDAIHLVAVPEKKEDVGLFEVKNEVVKIAEEGCAAIILDLKMVEFVTSTDIAALVGCVRHLQSRKGVFMVCGLGLRVAETFFIVNMDKVIPIRITVEETLLEIKRLDRRQDPLARLVAGNPDIAHIREWWDSVIRQKTQSIPKTELPPKTASADAPASTPLPSAASAPANPAASPSPYSSMSDTVRGVARACAPASAAHQANEGERTAASDPSRPAGDRSTYYEDWKEALDIFLHAKTLWGKHGLRMTGDITFKEYIAKLADKLLEK